MNYIAILVSAVVFMALGYLWYTPMLLGKPWMKLKGYSASSLKEAQKKMGPKYFFTFVAAILSAYVLSWIMTVSQVTTLTGGAWIGILVWIGFITTTQLGSWIFSESKKELYFIDTGYQLIGFILMGAILGMWR
jgi:hypothetical protein